MNKSKRFALGNFGERHHVTRGANDGEPAELKVGKMADEVDDRELQLNGSKKHMSEKVMERANVELEAEASACEDEQKFEHKQRMEGLLDICTPVIFFVVS